MFLSKATTVQSYSIQLDESIFVGLDPLPDPYLSDPSPLICHMHFFDPLFNCLLQFHHHTRVLLRQSLHVTLDQVIVGNDVMGDGATERLGECSGHLEGRT